jgi:hypothetical protein
VNGSQHRPEEGGGGAPTVTELFGRYDGAAMLAMLDEAGVIAALARRGFRDAAVEFAASEGPPVHTKVTALKQGTRHILIDACFTDVHLDRKSLDSFAIDGLDELDLLVVYWLREQDPTASFDAEHPRLPLQEHPGLGVLRRAFQVVVRMARELGRDGVAALPKFYHDAALFYHSRLFLFLAARDQGRFEAMARDFEGLPLGEASLALVRDLVRDEGGGLVRWQTSLQVMPLSERLVGVFHSPAWQEACSATLESHRFHTVGNDAASAPG